NTRLPYSKKEDIAIVQYILKHNYAFDIAGRKMWQMMERSNVGKIRTWQSLKERYIKHIRYELISGSHTFPFLSPEELKLLRQ
ncbi:hypothetical protein NL492_27010, partial [Klebsiella pneumoniae]|nr:hypothetical protein [Klebsiella pneumoniae]